MMNNVCNSAATILNDVLYSIGGYMMSKSVVWLDLLSEDQKWNKMKQVGHFSFLEFYWRDATVIQNQVIYFGLYNQASTYVLKQGKESKELEPVKEVVGIEYRRG